MPYAISTRHTTPLLALIPLFCVPDSVLEQLSCPAKP